jgi:hypothetical protein
MLATVSGKKAVFLVAPQVKVPCHLSVHLHLVPNGYRSMSSLSVNALKQLPFPTFAVSVTHDPDVSWLIWTVSHCTLYHCIHSLWHSLPLPKASFPFVVSVSCSLAQAHSLHYNTFDSKNRIIQNCVIQSVIFFPPSTSNLRDYSIWCSVVCIMILLTVLM